jgi:phospholipid transport system substrate-binding protein
MRMHWAVLAFVVTIISAPVTWAGNRDVETFAKDVIDGGLAILREDLTATARRDKFHAYIMPYVDARKTGLFTLGIYRRGADPQTLDAFVAAFASYSTAIYETRLDNYKDATLTLAGSIETKPGDFTVNTVANSARLREPVQISFRVAGMKGAYRVIDIQVVGIWLSVELRDEFSALLGRNNGSIDKLTEILIERTKSMLREVNSAEMGEVGETYAFGSAAFALLTNDWLK